MLLHCGWVQNRMKEEKVIAGGELNNINNSGGEPIDGHSSNEVMVCRSKGRLGKCVVDGW